MKRARTRVPPWLPAALLVAACGADEPSLEGTGEGGAEWLSGTVDERFQAVGEQLGGFSQTMLEVGQRYEHLHWAIQDGNLGHASYQAEKIGDAIERGIVRRPGRARSARALFLDEELPALRAAIDQDAGVEQAFERLTRACNACHVAEDMGFLRVGPPPRRSGPVLAPEPMP